MSTIQSPGPRFAWAALAVTCLGASTALAQTTTEPTQAVTPTGEREFTITNHPAALTSNGVVKSGFTAAGGAPCPDEILENYNIIGQTVAVPGFVAGEECAVILEAPANHYPIEITKIRIGWSSVFGGQPQTLEDSLRIYPNGLPNPGAFQYEAIGPVLTDGAINEFDLTVTAGSGSRIVNGGPFTVSLRIANNMTVSSPAPNHDGNGCQPGKNAILAQGLGWSDACSLGVSGDWIMSVTYRQVDCGQITDCNGNLIDDADEIANDPSLDCDSNGELDSCQIDADPSLDMNMNGMLDSCEPMSCLGDLTGDGVVNGADLATVLANWGMCN